MDYLVVCATALAAAALTLVSGFGLGTLLLPAFAVFFPLPVAVGATAVVHLANNLFKIVLVGRHARRSVVLAFGLPAAAAAFLGAWVLERLSHVPPVAVWEAFGREFSARPVGLTIGLLIFVFAAADLFRWTERWKVGRRWLPAGGLLSGFFGGLSGHQGALRSVFLIRLGLGKDGYIGTGVLCAVLVDLARLVVYGIAARSGPPAGEAAPPVTMLAAAILTAFLGSWIGTRLVKKVTLRTVEIVVGAGLLLLAAGVASGIV